MMAFQCVKVTVPNVYHTIIMFGTVTFTHCFSGHVLLCSFIYNFDFIVWFIHSNFILSVFLTCGQLSEYRDILFDAILKLFAIIIFMGKIYVLYLM